MTFKTRIAILFVALLTLLPLSNSSARYNNFYLQQQSYRNTQMLQQQQMRQQQMLQQQRMREQQAQQRRQQEQARRQQEQMRRQMQERQRQAQLQRQRTAERQRQMQQKRQKKAQEQQRTQAQRQQLAKQQKALQQQRSLREQRKTKLRQDRLRRLQNDRLKKRKAEKKKRDQSTALTLAALLKRNSLAAKVAKPVTGTVSKKQSHKQFQEKRQNQLKKQRVTKHLEQQRKTIQVRAQKARELKKRLAKSRLQNKKAVEKKKANQNKAEKAFGACRGKGCGNKSCSFHGDTRVLTKDGLKPIKSITSGQDFVWSRSEVTGKSDWMRVTNHYANDYEETVHIAIRDNEHETIQTILSNRIHPFFVVDEGVQSDELSATGDADVHLFSGQWVEAGSLIKGDKVVTHDARVVEVVDQKVENSTLRAYNITVDKHHTFFIADASTRNAPSVWVHNDCDVLKGTKNLSKEQRNLIARSEKTGKNSRVTKVGVGNKVLHHHFTRDKKGNWKYAGAISKFQRYKVGDFPKVASKISQKQLRHISGRGEYRGGGYLNSLRDAQKVLDAYRSGAAMILGKTKHGFPIVRYKDVTGTNVNIGAGVKNQPTNIFIIKGTKKPSIVPTNPNWIR